MNLAFCFGEINNLAEVKRSLGRGTAPMIRNNKTIGMFCTAAIMAVSQVSMALAQYQCIVYQNDIVSTLNALTKKSCETLGGTWTFSNDKLKHNLPIEPFDPFNPNTGITAVDNLCINAPYLPGCDQSPDPVLPSADDNERWRKQRDTIRCRKALLACDKRPVAQRSACKSKVRDLLC